jgi:hypothetical protein
MPKQTGLQDVRISLDRDLATCKYIYPLFDRNFVSRYFVLDLGEEKVVIVDANLMSKIGEDINFRVTAADVIMLETVNPVIFYGTNHADPWGNLARVKGPEEIRKGLITSNLFGRRFGGQKLSDIIFNESLMAVTAFELKTLGIIKKEVPVSEIVFGQDGQPALKQAK